MVPLIMTLPLAGYEASVKLLILSEKGYSEGISMLAAVKQWTLHFVSGYHKIRDNNTMLPSEKSMELILIYSQEKLNEQWCYDDSEKTDSDSHLGD